MIPVIRGMVISEKRGMVISVIRGQVIISGDTRYKRTGDTCV